MFRSQLHQTVINMHKVFCDTNSDFKNLQKESQQIPWDDQNDCFSKDHSFATNSWKEHRQ